MHIVTSGSTYIDIDAYGAMIALAELYNKSGQPAVAASSAPLNESITPTLRSLKVELEQRYEPSQKDDFTLVDISYKEYFDPIVDIDRVIGVIDHHPGYESYWQAKLGNRARIEAVGSACTQVFEEWQSKSMTKKMSRSSALLLAAGILDNTLNFGAKITDQRDLSAYSRLVKLANIPENFSSDYFLECQEFIERDIVASIKNDTKLGMPNLPSAVGQISVWDARSIIKYRFDQIVEAMQNPSGEWLVNVISISEGCSFLVASSPVVQKQISSLLSVEFEGSLARSDRMWLRKEILAAALCAK